MFKVELGTAIYIYLFFFFILACISNMILKLNKKHKEKPVTLQQQVFRCPICTHVYLFETDKDITQCPQCKSYNKRIENK